MKIEKVERIPPTVKNSGKLHELWLALQALEVGDTICITVESVRAARSYAVYVRYLERREKLLHHFYRVVQRREKVYIHRPILELAEEPK